MFLFVGPLQKVKPVVNTPSKRAWVRVTHALAVHHRSNVDGLIPSLRYEVHIRVHGIVLKMFSSF